MFIAMNRFQVQKGSEADIEAVWLFALRRGGRGQSEHVSAHFALQRNDAFRNVLRLRPTRCRNAGEQQTRQKHKQSHRLASLPLPRRVFYI